MYLTCPVAKIKSTTVEGPQPEHGRKSVCEAPFSSAQSDIRHEETLLHSRQDNCWRTLSALMGKGLYKLSK